MACGSSHEQLDRAASVAFNKSRDGSRRLQALHVWMENAVRKRGVGPKHRRSTWERSRRPCAAFWVASSLDRIYASSSRRASPKLPPCSPRSAPFGPRPSPRNASTREQAKGRPRGEDRQDRAPQTTKTSGGIGIDWRGARARAAALVGARGERSCARRAVLLVESCVECCVPPPPRFESSRALSVIYGGGLRTP